MGARNIGIVLIRLFCIYLAVNSLQQLLSFLPRIFEFRGDLLPVFLSPSIWLLCLVVLIPLVIAIWLWRRVDFVLPKGEESVSEGEVGDKAMLIGVSLFGLYLFVWGLILALRVEASLSSSGMPAGELNMAQRMPYLAQLVISVPLLLGRRRISTLLLKAKYADTGAT